MKKQAKRQIVICIAVLAVIGAAVALWAVFMPRTQCAVFIAAENADTDRVTEIISDTGPERVSVSFCSPDAAEYPFRFAAMRETDCDLFVLREKEFEALDTEVIFCDISAYTGGETPVYGARLSEDSALRAAFTGDGTYYLCLYARSRHVQDGQADGMIGSVIQALLQEDASGAVG